METGGSDSANAGMFDPSNANMLADYAISNANTSTPTVSSATDPFQAGDANNWFFLKSGTNSIPMWAQITLVSGGVATLNCAIGACVLTNYTANTVVGCGTAASLTSQTGSIDFSQNTASISLTGFTTAAANAIILTATARKAYVGNGIQTTAGTNVVLGFFAISSVVTGVSMTVDRNVTTAAGIGGAGGIGGALATISQASTNSVSGNYCFVKAGSGYSITANLSFPTNTVTYFGYASNRTDNGRATITVSSTATTILSVTNFFVCFRNFVLDAANIANFCLNANASGNGCYLENCRLTRFANTGYSSAGTEAILVDCEVDTGKSGASAAVSMTGAGINSVVGCSIHDNPCVGLSFGGGTSRAEALNNLIINNTGASSDGILNASAQTRIIGNTIYASGRDGVRQSSVFSGSSIVRNNIIVNSGAFGLKNTSAVGPGTTSGALFGYDYNAFFNNSSGDLSAIPTTSHTVTLTSDPFINAAGGNFALTPAAIALIGSQGIPGTFPGLASTTGYLAIGAVQPLAQGIFVQTNTVMITSPLSVVGYH